jgi:hypothetical protein
VVTVAIASALERLNRLEEALQQYRQYLLAEPDGSAAQKARAGIKSVTSRLQPSLPPLVPSMPSEGSTKLARPPAPPAVPSEYGGRKLSMGVIAATGGGVLAIVGLGWWLNRPKRVKSNRRRR